ncbi:MAG: SH3 domain-containing protein [Chloroflexi bacterium]|nr:SH3 domain-containing protein [Chloroflexota bacterium]
MRSSRGILFLVLVLLLAGLGLEQRLGRSVEAQTDDGPGLVVFASDRTGDYEIYTLDPETGQTTRLTNDPGQDIQPVWAPDGETIAFVSDRDGDYELFVMRADGTDVRQLTNNEASESSPAWQPGGEYLVYYSDVNGQWDVFTISADGALVRQLTNDAFDERGALAVDEGLEPGAGGAATPGTTAPTSAPQQPQATAVPDATVDSRQLNLRANPGEGADILGVLPNDMALDIIGRRFDNSWVQVTTPTGLTGWVFASLLEINIDLNTVPVVNAQFIAPPPTLTPVPTLTLTPTPGAVIIEFWADRGSVTPGQCVTLSWRVENINSVFYQGTGVAGSGSSQECPAATTTYNLRVIRRDGVEDNRFITIQVAP